MALQQVRVTIMEVQVLRIFKYRRMEASLGTIRLQPQ